MTTTAIRKSSEGSLLIITIIAVVLLGGLMILPWMFNNQETKASSGWLSLPLLIILGTAAYGGWKARNDDTVWPQRVFYGVCALVFIWAVSVMTIGEDTTNKVIAEFKSDATSIADDYVEDRLFDEDQKVTSYQQSNTTRSPSTTAPTSRLTADAYEDQTYGKFERVSVNPGLSNRTGPITNFGGDSLCHTQAGGTGRLVIWSRSDFTSEPVRATMARDGINIASFGHLGAPWQLFYGAEGGSATLLLERKDRPDAC